MLIYTYTHIRILLLFRSVRSGGKYNAALLHKIMKSFHMQIQLAQLCMHIAADPQTAISTTRTQQQQ